MDIGKNNGKLDLPAIVAAINAVSNTGTATENKI